MFLAFVITRIAMFKNILKSRIMVSSSSAALLTSGMPNSLDFPLPPCEVPLITALES